MNNKRGVYDLRANGNMRRVYIHHAERAISSKVEAEICKLDPASRRKFDKLYRVAMYENLQDNPPMSYRAMPSSDNVSDSTVSARETSEPIGVYS